MRKIILFCLLAVCITASLYSQIWTPADTEKCASVLTDLMLMASGKYDIMDLIWKETEPGDDREGGRIVNGRCDYYTGDVSASGLIFRTGMANVQSYVVTRTIFTKGEHIIASFFYSSLYANEWSFFDENLKTIAMYKDFCLALRKLGAKLSEGSESEAKRRGKGTVGYSSIWNYDDGKFNIEAGYSSYENERKNSTAEIAKYKYEGRLYIVIHGVRGE